VDDLKNLKFRISCADAFFHAIEKRSDKADTDAVLFSLWNEFILLANEITYLFETEHCIGNTALAREMFEILLYYNYIMKDQSDFRAKCYIYYTLLDELKAAIFLKEGTDEYNKLVSINPSLSFFKDLDKDIVKHISEMEAVINRAKYDEVRNAVSTKNKTWYSVASGINNIRDLSKEVNMEDKYITLYNIYCKQTHGMRVIRNAFYKNKLPDKYIDCSTMITNAILSFMSYYSNKFDIKQEIKDTLIDSGFLDLVMKSQGLEPDS